MVYKWKQGSQFKISAQSAGERIDEIKNGLGRGLKAEDVVDDARSGRSPLHKAFDWDDKKAARQHRLNVAREILRSLVTIYVDVTKPNDKKTIRSFISLRDPGKSCDRTFYPMAQVLSDEEKRAQLIREALNEFRSWRDRYRHIQELVSIFEAGNLLLGKIPTVIRRKQTKRSKSREQRVAA